MSLRSFLDAWGEGKRRRVAEPGASSMTARDEEWQQEQARYIVLRFSIHAHPAARHLAERLNIDIPIDSPLGRQVDEAMAHLEGEL